MSYIPPTGSTVAFQSDPTKLLSHASVSGSVTALQGTNPWNISNTSVAVMSVVPHSVATLQGTNPWMVQLTSGSVITTGGNSSVQVVGLMPPQSVSGVGTFNIDPQGAGSIIAKLINSSVTAYQGVTPWVIHGSVAVMSAVPTSVTALQGTNPWFIGNSSVQVVNMVPASVSGVGLFNVNHTGNGSVLVVVPGSVATAPFPASVSGVGIFNVNHTGNGSIQTVWTSPSIVGTYSEDSTHTSADRGIFVFGVRNDTLASFVSANTEYTPFGHDSAGRVLTKPFAPVESSFVATASTVNAGFGTNQAASVRVLAAPGAGLKWYITDLNVSNTGSVATLVTLTDDASLTLWKGIAPGGGGNNMPGLNTPIVSATANTPLGLVSGTAASIVHIWVAGYKAP